ncbi:MAG TPA: molybdopterin-binding protein, partial [Aestuariivirga sp.]
MTERAFIPIGIAVMTVSDTRTMADDKSGDILAERIKAAGHRLAGRVIVKDDVRQIRAAARKFLADKNVDVVISTGGTGLTGRDVTIEALRPLFEKEIEGFGTVFHMIS